MTTRIVEPLEGIEFRMEVPESANLQGGVSLTFSIWNKKTRPIVYPEMGISDWPNFSMRVLDTRGDRVRPTPNLGERFTRNPPPSNYNRYVQIDPGEKKEWKVELSELFEVSTGTYSLLVQISAFDSDRNPRYGRRDDAGRLLPSRPTGEISAVGRFEDVPIRID